MCRNKCCCGRCGSNQNDWNNGWQPVWDPCAGEGRWVYYAGFNDGYRVGLENGRRDWRPCNR